MEAAGLMGYPLGRKGVLTTEDNLDNILDGIYWSTNTNVPENNPSGTYNNIYIQIVGDAIIATPNITILFLVFYQ